MDLLGQTLKNELQEMHENNVVISFIGDTTKKYIVINLVVKSTEITLKDIEDYIITLH